MRVLAGRDPARGTTDTGAGQRVPAGSGRSVWEDAEAGAQGAGCVLLRAQVKQCRADCRTEQPDGRFTCKGKPSVLPGLTVGAEIRGERELWLSRLVRCDEQILALADALRHEQVWQADRGRL
jgi:hypothetical protein